MPRTATIRSIYETVEINRSARPPAFIVQRERSVFFNPLGFNPRNVTERVGCSGRTRYSPGTGEGRVKLVRNVGGTGQDKRGRFRLMQDARREEEDSLCTTIDKRGKWAEEKFPR